MDVRRKREHESEDGETAEDGPGKTGALRGAADGGVGALGDERLESAERFAYYLGLTGGRLLCGRGAVKLVSAFRAEESAGLKLVAAEFAECGCAFGLAALRRYV